jgi:hypothetical protein
MQCNAWTSRGHHKSGLHSHRVITKIGGPGGVANGDMHLCASRVEAREVVLQKLVLNRKEHAVTRVVRLRQPLQTGERRPDSPQDVPFPDATHLPLPDHVHHLVSLERSPGRLQRKESQSRFGQPFDEAVILLHQIVEVFDLPELYTVGKESSGLRSAIALG